MLPYPSMDSLIPIATTLAPMFTLIVAGYVAGRWVGIRGENIAPLLIYLITPVVIFTALVRAPLGLSTLLLPLMTTLLCYGICLLCFYLCKTVIPSPSRNVAAFAAGNANSGYFAIPVGIAMLGEQALPLIVLIGFGFLIFENTLGVYLMACGKYSSGESFRRVLRLPTLYAFLLGIGAASLDLTLPRVVSEFVLMIRHTYSVLGMMLLGLGLAAMERARMDLRFLGMTIVMKHIVWPLLAIGVLTLEHLFVGGLGTEEREAFLFMSMLPLAANTVAWATLLQAEPEKASTAVLASTVVGSLGLLSFPLLRSLL